MRVMYTSQLLKGKDGLPWTKGLGFRVSQLLEGKDGLPWIKGLGFRVAMSRCSRAWGVGVVARVVMQC
jgi:hypothetical protein